MEQRNSRGACEPTVGGGAVWVMLRPAAGTSAWNELLCPVTFSICVQLLRCRAPTEWAMRFLQGWDLSCG